MDTKPEEKLKKPHSFDGRSARCGTLPDRHLAMKNKDNTSFPCFLAQFLWLVGGLELAQRCPRKRSSPKFKMFDTFVYVFFSIDVLQMSFDSFVVLHFAPFFTFLSEFPINSYNTFQW